MKIRASAKSWALLAIAFLLSPHQAAQAAALAVEPLMTEVQPLRSTSLRVTNEADQPTSVEVTIEERLVDENGNQTRRPADDDFIVLPPQASIAPHSVQVVRLQYVGEPQPNSRSYYATVRQLPVTMEPGAAGSAQIQVLFAFDVAVHIVPNGAKSLPKVEAAALTTVEAPVKVDDGTLKNPTNNGMATFQAAEVTVTNEGNKYAYLQELAFKGTGTDKNGNTVNIPQWTENEIISAAGTTLLPPGAKRKLVLPLRNLPELTSVSIDVDKITKVQ